MVFVNPAGQTNDVTSMPFLLSEKRYKVNCFDMQDNWKVLIWSAVVGPITKSKCNLTAQHVTQTIFLIALDRCQNFVIFPFLSTRNEIIFSFN